ncbi:MAG TPA: hypothetical protein VH268_04320 [Solirubrobacterales bacterium]|jgi:hypothetical protein|nr:hypothetical protein [Solirubrobacterales bacterium]
MESLPAPPPGPVADKLSIWPLDSGQYGLDASFQGRSGFERMERHEAALKAAGVNSYRSSATPGRCGSGRWSAAEVSVALRSFVH